MIEFVMGACAFSRNSDERDGLGGPVYEPKTDTPLVTHNTLLLLSEPQKDYSRRRTDEIKYPQRFVLAQARPCQKGLAAGGVFQVVYCVVTSRDLHFLNSLH